MTEEEDSENFFNTGIATYFAYHIINPCSTKVGDKDENIRDFWIREAKNSLPNFQNPCTKSFLELVIKDYSP